MSAIYNHTESIVVHAKEKYLIHANNLVKKAMHGGEGKRAEGYDDNKCLVKLEDIVSLIAAGSRILVINNKKSGQYFHDVIFKDHRFIAVSEKPITPVIHIRYQ